jgi:hypothetical protein
MHASKSFNFYTYLTWQVYRSTAAKFRYYGIAPFDIEVIYDILSSSFDVYEEQLAIDDNQYVSMVEIEFPLPFSESFFQFFTMERWYKIKGVIKEMKRRRGKKGVKAFLCFFGIAPEINSHLVFSLMNKSNRQFEMGIEKIEYLVDILPMQLGTLPANVEEITYSYDEVTFKWHPHTARSNEGLEYIFNNNSEWIRRA